MAEQLGDVGTTFLFENDRVKVWHLELQPSESSSWHQHTLDYLYIVIEPGIVRTEYEDGTYDEQEDKVGDAVMHRHGPAHRLVNLGTSRYVNVIVELKN